MSPFGLKCKYISYKKDYLQYNYNDLYYPTRNTYQRSVFICTTYYFCDCDTDASSSLMNFLDYSRKPFSFVASLTMLAQKNGGQITFRLVHLYQCMCTIFKTGVYLESYTANT